MPVDSVHSSIDSAIGEAERLRNVLRKGSHRQVRAAGEKEVVKATVLAWFHNHRVSILTACDESSLSAIDSAYSEILSASEHGTARDYYRSKLANLKSLLVVLRSQLLTQGAGIASKTSTSDLAPDFAPLVADKNVHEILRRRWNECAVCISAGAPMAATVMIGGLLEALLLARVNRETNQSPIFRAKSAPRDKVGKTLSLKDWALKNYIDVAHELGWITKAAKDISEVLRDYRNYIHPYKELSHSLALTSDDSKLFWEVGKSLSRQVIASAP